MGYHRAGFDVVGVDIAPQKHYPFTFILGDALEYCAEHGKEFDAIHASPPCQAHVQLRGVNMSRWGNVIDHPSLIAQTRVALKKTGRPFVIENVVGAPLENYFILRGAEFDLRVDRPRAFESNMLIFELPAKRQGRDVIGVYGRLDGRRLLKRIDGTSPRAASSIEEARDAMGIDWMDEKEITQAIPPAYTEFIGKQLIQCLQSELLNPRSLSSKQSA